jgi:hypothetical protein
MGGHPYWYVVDYRQDIGAALNALRNREFVAGRYNPVTPYPGDLLPIGPHSLAPGAAHASIEDALQASDADGTRSILDINSIADAPTFCASCAFSSDELTRLFGTTTPSVDQINACDEFWDTLERGQARHIVIHGSNGPTHLFFAGYSFD